MALILAVNPGGRHSPVLARLARELPGHELIGADSCSVAIDAVARRPPDLVLLPSLPESEEAKLLARLRTVPGGVRILELPPLTPGDPIPILDLAGQIRDSLASPPGATPAKAEQRAHLIAAGKALANWVRARRATWSDAAMAESMREAASRVEPPKAPAKTVAVLESISEPIEATRKTATVSAARSVPEPPVEPLEILERDRSAQRQSFLRWLPRIAALAVLAALAVAAVTYGPGLRSRLTSGVLVLESGPAGSQVFVDGRLVGTTPISLDIPAGQHSVEFRNGDLSRATEVTVAVRSRVVQRVDWMAAPTGSLRVRSEPSGARVLVDGTARGTTPLTLDTIAAGAHTIVLDSKAGSVRRSVTIVAGQAAELTESIFPGSIAVFAPFEIEIAEGNGSIRLDDRGRAMLPAGSHTLRFRNRELGYEEVRTIEINPGDTATVNLTPQTTISVTATEPSEVWIDGARVGETPLTKQRINLGLRVILVKPATGDERQFSVTATSKPVQIDVDFSKPQG